MQNSRILNLVKKCESPIVLLSLVGLGVFFLPLLEAVNFGSALAVGIILSFLVMSLRRKAELIIVILLCFLFHAQWGVAEFIFQSDLNLRLLGETELSADKVGVAKFGDDKTLRAYGPYKHANSFGGVMVIALALWLIANSKIVALKSWNSLALILVFAILFSFSRSALMALLFLSLVVLVRGNDKVRGLGFVGLIVVAILVFTPFYIDRLGDSEDMGITERLSGYDWSLQIIKDNGLWKGVGFGHYKETLKKQLDESGVNYSAWQIDYVHSVPLLSIAVVGLLPVIILSAVLFGLIYRFVSRFKLLVLLSIVPLLMFDHYLVTQITPFIYLMLLITI